MRVSTAALDIVQDGCGHWQVTQSQLPGPQKRINIRALQATQNATNGVSRIGMDEHRSCIVCTQAARIPSGVRALARPGYTGGVK